MTRVSRRLHLHILALVGVLLTMVLMSAFATGPAFAAKKPPKHHPVHPMVVGVGFQPYAVVMGDFNKDGKLDLAVTNAQDNTVSVMPGRGDGTFAPQVTYPVGRYPEAVATGDFNGDGKLDLVTTNFNDHTISVLLGNGDGTFASQVAYPVGKSPSAVAIGDLNNDGNLDLAVVNQFDNNMSILLGNGDGTFTSNTLHVSSQNISETAGVPFTTTVGDVIGAQQASVQGKAKSMRGVCCATPLAHGLDPGQARAWLPGHRGSVAVQRRQDRSQGQ